MSEKIGKNYSLCNKGQRNKSDFYQTSYSMTQHILDREKILGSCLEPSCGKKAIVKVLKKNNINCKYSDINRGEDFLLSKKRYDTIITNPPFSIALEFVKHAKKTGKKENHILATFKLPTRTREISNLISG